MNNSQYEYLDAYLDEMRSRGRFTFTSNEVIEKFHLTEMRLKKQFSGYYKKTEWPDCEMNSI